MHNACRAFRIPEKAQGTLPAPHSLKPEPRVAEKGGLDSASQHRQKGQENAWSDIVGGCVLGACLPEGTLRPKLGKGRWAQEAVSKVQSW